MKIRRTGIEWVWRGSKDKEKGRRIGRKEQEDDEGRKDRERRTRGREVRRRERGEGGLMDGLRA